MGGLIILLLESLTATAPIIADTYSNAEFDSKQRATANSFINMFASFIYALGVLIGLDLIGK